ncbi:hypothetical protein [Propionibacterium australiense]|uniref:hypothetical protein n=1 Tax=Propionibacterium australiense TaxID=119981 RepID=UPI0011C3AA8F|nr:hypothetical protein [Propionibacterium australiense]
MNQDISRFLWEAHMTRGRWSEQAASIVSWTAALHLSIQTYWDTDTGEDWITFQTNDKDIGFLGVKIPLLFANDVLMSIPWPFPVTVVRVDDIENAELTCRDDVLDEVFEGRIRRHILGADPISARDLWFSTL